MFVKIPQQKDELKESIEKISKQSKKQGKVSQQSQADYQEKIIERIKENIGEFENGLEKLIKNLLDILLNFAPSQILEAFATKYSLSTAEFFTSNNHKDDLKLVKLDYILSLMTSFSDVDFGKNEFAYEKFEEAQEILEKILMQSMFYLMFTSEHKGELSEVKFVQTLHHMVVRGDSYSIHKVQMCRELFTQYDDVLKSKFSLTANQLIDIFIEVAEIPLRRLEIQKNYYLEVKKAHKEFVSTMDSLPNEEKMDFFRNYKDSEMRNSTVKELEKIYEETEVEFGSSLFNIVKNKLPNEILETLSIRLGENTDFKQGKIAYFLNNDTQIYDKPFIKLGEEYHCYNSPVIYYKLQNLLESILLNTIPANKHQKLYFAKKGEYLEDKSLELIESVLPNSKIFKNLKYGTNFEVDGLVIFDDNIFIVESKSNKFTIGAKKGNIEKIKTDTKNIVEKAYQQATRAKKYILENDISEFKDKNGKVVLRLEKKDFNNIYLINTTLEPLNRLSTDLNSLKSFGFLQEEEWIWSVYLNDLRVICEILDSPSEFLLYVDRRIKYNNYPQVKMADELDVFGYFLERGLYFDDIEFPKSNFMLTIDHSYAHDIDLYYYWKEGSILEEIKKPSLYGKMKNIKSLVCEIENINKGGATTLGKLLLNFNGNTQNFITEQIKLMRGFRRNDFHIPISDENVGIYFIQQKLSKSRNIEEICEIYAYERKINNWYVMIIGVDGLVDFIKLEFNNAHSERLENEVKELRQFRFEQVTEIGKKIGRNDVCPCGSGKKYKKCCLK